jgi:UDP-2,3-diacylglucosamine hydrolase
MTQSAPPKLGLIASGGRLPELLREARPDMFVLGLEGSADPKLADTLVPVGRAGRIFATLRAAGCTQVALAGLFLRPSFASLRLDWTGVGILLRLLPVWGGDASLLARVVAEFERAGFTVIGVPDVRADLLMGAGALGREIPTDKERTEIDTGFAAAKALGKAERGQAVLVHDGTVHAKEGRAGTAALIRNVSLPGGVLVKAAMPGQDRRVDLPTIGPDTIKQAKRAGLRGVAMEAGAAIVIDRAATIAAADAAGIFVFGVTS